MSRSLTIATLVLPLSFMSACSSMPKDAPHEFVEAKSSLDTMDKDHAKKKLPNTAERAHDKFDEALKDLKSARKAEEPETAAIEKARETKQIADSAIAMNSKVLAWDDDQNQLNAALESLRNGGTVAVVDSGTDSPFAKLRDKDIVSTVAYFETNDSQTPIWNQKQFDSLAAVLNADRSFHVILTGHADARGDDEYNQNLAMERAKTIAAALQERGCEEGQIVYRSAGSTEASGDDSSVARMQLDRSVEAVVNLR